MLFIESEIIEYKFKRFLQKYYKKSMGKDIPLEDSLEFLKRDDIPYISDWLIEVHIDYVEIMLTNGMVIYFRYSQPLLELLNNFDIIESETTEENFYRFTKIMGLLFPDLHRIYLKDI